MLISIKNPLWLNQINDIKFLPAIKKLKNALGFLVFENTREQKEYFFHSKLTDEYVLE